MFWRKSLQEVIKVQRVGRSMKYEYGHVSLAIFLGTKVTSLIS